MSIHDCCGTSCDKQTVAAELHHLRTFKVRVMALLAEAEQNLVAVGVLKGGMMPDLLNNRQPVCITRYGAQEAYMLPDSMVRELLLRGAVRDCDHKIEFERGEE